MKKVANIRRNTLILLLAAMALRALMPVGYMPGSLSSGLLFELCPDGMPAGFVQALGGQHHHGAGDDDAAAHSFEQCTTGHLLAPAAITSSAPATLDLPDQPALSTIPRLLVTAAPRVAYSSRAPPVIT